MNKPNRGRASKVELLPEEVKRFLDAMLRDKRHSQQEILDEVNKQLTELGAPQSELISSSGLNRYALRMESIGKKMRETNAIADAWVARLGDKPQSQLGKLVTQMIHTMAFELSLDMQNGAAEVSVGDLKELALVVQRLEQAETSSVKREQQIRQAFAQEAAASVEQAAKELGLTKAGTDAIKAGILGLAT
ncbi:MAG: DUF3486 family protein [Venatoribacter sp.]